MMAVRCLRRALARQSTSNQIFPHLRTFHVRIGSPCLSHPSPHILLRARPSAAVRSGMTGVAQSSERKEADLADTVDPYDEHLLVFTGTESAALWPATLDNDTTGVALVRALKREIVARQDELDGMKVMLSAVSARLTFSDAAAVGNKEARNDMSRDLSDVRTLSGVMAMNNRLCVESTNAGEASALVTDLLVNPAQNRPPSTSLPIKRVDRFSLEQSVFVCVHGSCHERCGSKGAAVLKRLQTELATGAGQVRVMGISCVGECERAATVLAYPGGHWYGEVGESDVQNLAVTHWKLADELEPRHWRGKMGMSRAQQRDFRRRSAFFLPSRWD